MNENIFLQRKNAKENVESRAALNTISVPTLRILRTPI